VVHTQWSLSNGASPAGEASQEAGHRTQFAFGGRTSSRIVAARTEASVPAAYDGPMTRQRSEVQDSLPAGVSRS